MKIWRVISSVNFILFNFLSLAGVLIRQVDGCTDVVKLGVQF